jgi:hypothetical protein
MDASEMCLEDGTPVPILDSSLRSSILTRSRKGNQRQESLVVKVHVLTGNWGPGRAIRRLMTGHGNQT